MESITAPTTDWNFLIDNISFTPVPLSGVLLRWEPAWPAWRPMGDEKEDYKLSNYR
jgi:hypothetical protein